MLLLVIDSASLKCRHLFRDSCAVKSAGLEVDILSVVFISALCKIDALVCGFSDFNANATSCYRRCHCLSYSESSTLHYVTCC
jgi:hypothetical protein